MRSSSLWLDSTWFALACLLGGAGMVSATNADPTESPDQAPASTAVAEPGCEEPELPPRIEPKQREIDRFNLQYDKYRVCMTAYINAERAKSKEYESLAQAHVDAGNKAVSRFNEFGRQVKEATGQQ